MASLPPTLILTLRKGTVYKATHRSLKSNLPHFLIVLNSNPRTSKTLLLGVISSKITETLLRRKLEPRETVVLLREDEYHELTKDSVVDCNSPLELKISELIKQLHHYQPCDDLPEHIVEKLIMGVKKSRMVDNDKKRVLQ